MMPIRFFFLSLSLTFIFAEQHSVKQAVKIHDGRPRTVSDHPAILRINNSSNNNVGTGMAINGCMITASHLIRDNYNVNLQISNADASFRTRIDDAKVKFPMPGNYYLDGVRSDDIAVVKLDDKPKSYFNSSVLDEEFCKTFLANLKKGPVQGIAMGYGATFFRPGRGYHFPKRKERPGFSQKVPTNESADEKKTREYKENLIGELHDGDVKISQEKDTALMLEPGPHLPLAGDSGCPIFVLDEKNNKKLVGVDSAGYDDKMLGVSANICKNIHWIKERLKEYGCL